MSDNKRSPGKRHGSKVGRKSKNTFVTKSGQSIKIHRNLSERFQARRDAIARRKALRLAGLPKSRVKRFIYRLHPVRLYKYWFSREGLIMGLKITGIGLIAGFLLLVGLFAYFRKDLPNLRDISGNNIGGSIRYYDRTGKVLLWEDYDAVKRIPVRGDVAQVMKDATVAIEDKDFFKHGGFDVRGIARAGWNNAVGHGGTQGGSTITQQLVKLTQNWTRDRSYTRKIKELILAVELERSYSKKEILDGYLDTAPYGSIDYGVEAASRDYFHKPAKDLKLDEAAFLAAIPKAPGYYSPYNPEFKTNGGKEALVGRQHYILDLMEQQGMITAEQRDKAKKVNTIAHVKPRQPKYAGITAPYFVLTAKEELEAKRGTESAKVGGWKVITTLDMKLQKDAEEEVAKGLVQVRRQGGDSAAFVAEDVKTGQVVALVGGADFSNKEYGQNNYARLRIPPGSSFKPYDYTSLIENHDNFGAGSVLYDSQGPLDGYPCTNKARPKNGGNCLYDYDFRYPGPITLRYALGGSRNVPAVKAMLITGINKTIETAEKMGLDSGYKCYDDDKLTREAQCYASSAIGDGAYLRLDEHVNAYSTLSRNGVKLPKTYILKIEDANGKTLDEWKASKGEQVIRPDTAYIVSDIMSDPRASYFSTKIHNFNGHKYSIKTGTTNDAKDGLLMGFSTQYAAGVWVGYHNRQVRMSGFMETMTRPIWKGWMDRAHADLKPEERQKPSDIQTLPAYVVRNHVGTGSIEPSPSTDLFPSWYKPKTASRKQKTIDIVSNKLATDCTPERAKKVITETDANTFSGDRFVTSASSTSSEKDDVHRCDDVKPRINIDSAPDSCNGSCTINVTVTQGTHPLSSTRFRGTVNVVIDGQIVQAFSVDSSGSLSLPFTYNGTGTKTVKVEVIDSVLYDGSDSTSIQFASDGGGGSTSDPLTLTGTRSGTDLSFSWSGGVPGTVTVYRDSTNDEVCHSDSDDSCTGSSITPTKQTYYAKDSEGNTSDKITI